MRIRPKELARLRQYPLVKRIYPATRDVADAVREAGWIREEFEGRSLKAVRRACLLRGRGVPLQYVVGNTPFGDAKIKCQPGVLIPRWETEEWAMRLADLLRTGLDASQPIKVLDLCSGTGCIPIGLAHYVPQGSTLYGVDVNPRAVELIRKNTLVNAGLLQGRELVPLCSDVLDDTSSLARTIQTDSVDLVTANPPYVYADEYRHGTDLAVRRFEPRLALIGGVEFYEKIYQHARALRAKAIVFEVGNSHQIEFVRRLAAKFDWKSVPVQDSAKNPRGVALWNDPNWEFLAAMTD